jgi:hypothetical protein
MIPCAAAAEDALGVLAVEPPPGPGPALVRLTGGLRDALAARAPGVLSPEALRARMTASAPPAVLPELDRAHSGALAAHLAGEYDASNRTLRSVIERLERLPDGPEVFAAWTRTTLRLARSEQELGRAVEAQAVLERLLRAAPDLRVDPRQYPPSFQALVEQGRARLRALGTCRLTVEAAPETRVFVEGREVGTSPVTLEVARGRYRVSGLRGGVRSPAVILDVAEDRSVQLDLSVAEAMRPGGGPGLALAVPPASARVAAAAARLGLDRAVAAGLHREGDAVFLDAVLFDVQRGVVEREGRIPLTNGVAASGAEDALAAFLAGGDPSPPVVAVQRAALAVSPDAAERILSSAGARAGPRASRTPGWVAVGTGVAAVAAGTAAGIVAYQARSSYGDARAMLAGGRVLPPHTVAEYNATLDRGDRQHQAAIVVGVAAAACAATSALLGYWSWRTTGEIGPLRF